MANEKPPSKPVMHASTMQEATAATKAELNLGLAESLKLYRKACLWSIFFSTCVVMGWFDMLSLNSLYAYPPFQRQFGIELEDGTYELTAAWQSGLSIGAFGGQIIGLSINGIITDRFGYRKTLIGALIGRCGFIFIIFFSETTVQLLIGELLFGVPWGVFQTITITYASEVTGQFIASGVLPPESPWWLVRRGRLDDAKKSLSRLTTRNSGIPFQPDETISMIIFTNEMEKKTEEGTTYLEQFKSVNLRRTEIVCVTWMIQTFCGNTFSSYSTYFYEQVGLVSESSFSMTLGQYVLGAVGTFLSWLLMRQFGRRTLYLSGQVFMCILLFVIGYTSFAGHGNTAVHSTVGPLCYSLVSELPSTRLRIKSTVVARNVYNVVCIISNLITPRMINPTAWGWGTNSGFFWAGSCFLCAMWTCFRLPEPKGRTYGELDVLFEKRISARKFKTTYIEQFNNHEYRGEGVIEGVIVGHVNPQPPEKEGKC
ncbi:major facilitator superfamily domain-containing protein [Aspergillus bertholletiae]|uniref:Major facilitator superfamily domain-containing protein n=1 Tax=Aspergillus bertholletiae TaxID=1226010 RepID=A0A5N7AMQ3_9EURO|nr:major facilitator superfamily domain-containing protein [Aspergillus bertholletiae]